MAAIVTEPFTANGRTYRPPARPVVVVCLDGCADEYLDAALAHALMPQLGRMSTTGHRSLARGALPSFTNTNNASIATGVPPSVHGISGNFLLDPATGEKVMMNAAKYLRAPTLLAAASAAGRRVAVVTAKDKLREILAHGLRGISISAERARECRWATHGIEDVEDLLGEPTPPIYSAAASLFVLRAGAALLERGLADFLYLSLTDYVQHKHAPGEKEALDFLAAIDVELGRLVRQGAIVGLTADHGMNAKQTQGGAPNVIYLGTRLEAMGVKGATVILPITDPYVRHHGALGSFACIHLRDASQAAAIGQRLLQETGIVEVLDREMAARKLELPADRIGDLVVLSGRSVALGTRAEEHDLAALEGGLRSHGGRYEEMVPFIVSERLSAAYARRAELDLRNFDIFEVTVNGAGRR
jgi:phosphonoacetate hydrolase